MSRTDFSFISSTFHHGSHRRNMKGQASGATCKLECTNTAVHEWMRLRIRRAQGVALCYALLVVPFKVPWIISDHDHNHDHDHVQADVAFNHLLAAKAFGLAEKDWAALAVAVRREAGLPQ